MKQHGSSIIHRQFKIKNAKIDPLCKRLLQYSYQVVAEHFRSNNLEVMMKRRNFLQPAITGGGGDSKN